MKPKSHGPLVSIFSVSTAALVLISCACAISPAPGRTENSDLFNRLDKVIEARFQVNDANQFGSARVIAMNGHLAVGSLLTDETSREMAELRPVFKAPNILVVGVMHLRRWPKMQQFEPQPRNTTPFKLSSTVLEVTGTTSAQAIQTYKWADNSIGKASLWAAPAANSGHSVDGTYGKFEVAIRPIKATQESCIDCHTDVKKNDVLGAMIYMIAPTPHHERAPKVFTYIGTYPVFASTDRHRFGR